MDDRVRLIQGDCLDVMRGMEADSVDAVVTDPPYGTNKAAWDHSVDSEIIAECLRVCRGYALFFYSNTRLWHLLGIIKSLGRDAWTIPWVKPNAMGFERRFAPQWVPIVCVYRGNFPFWGKDLISCPIVPQKVDHPTPKPLPVVEWLVSKATDSGGLVCDPFAGSGTTAIACLRTDRRFIGCEINPAYHATARRRIDAELARTPLLTA